VTPDEAEREIRELKERVEDLENEREAIKQLPHAVAELHGAVDTLRDIVIGKLDTIGGSVERVSSIKTAIQFAALVIVPILVALIGGYFALKAGVHETGVKK
jgi:hypothetical protein